MMDDGSRVEWVGTRIWEAGAEGKHATERSGVQCAAWSGGFPNSPRRGACGCPVDGLIDHGGRQVAQRLMGPPVVVAAEPIPQSGPQRVHGGVLEQIDLLVFYAPPQPLDEDVVHPAPAAIHADLDSETEQFPGPFGRGELATLIGVEDLRNAT